LGSAEILWEPDDDWKRECNITRFAEACLGGEGRDPPESYAGLWQWSTDDIEGFWERVWKWFEVKSERPYKTPLFERAMPGARWFEGSSLNYAEHALAKSGKGPAIVAADEGGGRKEVSMEDLRSQVGAFSNFLRGAGVKKGDRVAAYATNRPETVAALLATVSIGAVWSSCPPDFGAPSVIDRFAQIGPRVLIASPEYTYGGRTTDRRSDLSSIRGALPTLERTVTLPGSAGGALPDSDEWDDALDAGGSIEFERVPFDHPLWVLYSSGTTGLPKPIVHGHGGIILEHYKALGLHNDLKPSDRFFWFSTTGWMMWNYLVGGLLLGSTLVLFDGSPSYPDLDALWNLAEKTGITFFGTSAPFIGACMKAGLRPAETHGLDLLRGLGSTGSPLSPDAFRWTYSNVKADVWLASVSGGTDLCTAFVGGCPTLPVRAGEIQCRYLGAKVEAYGEEGMPLREGVGELVITEPMPSMPLFFWGDADGSRYRESYFERFPGVWWHGDWIEILADGGCIIHGRSDATIKRHGVRIGTSEIYRVVESMPEVADSLAVDVDLEDGRSELLLFVVPAAGRKVDDSLASAIRERIRRDVSHRHLPDRIMELSAVPRTLSGKKLEVPVKRILMGLDPGRAANPGSVSDPRSLEEVARIGARLRSDWKL
jgi:acetoacetyl-CoA synthetase